MKPLLAYTVKDTPRFPVMASPKLDGIRCLIVDGVAVSRTLKPIPNAYVREMLAGLPNFDGELIVGNPTAPNCFQVTTSAVMSRDGSPDFTYRVFDLHSETRPFCERLQAAHDATVADIDTLLLPILTVPHKAIRDAEELAEYEAEVVAAGYEGVMIRDPMGAYKEGRSTEREGILGKIKRFEDAEAEIIGFEELLHNGNTAVTNALGRTERSTAKDGLTGGDTLGALICRAAGYAESFKIGTGYTAAQRAQLWGQRDSLLGQLAKFKHQPSGAKDAPRFPVFAGIRLD